ncbi:MAG: LysR family transcriptional regulator [bacterium]|nr:LysR family transcriptional regulator [bacterium]
MDRFDAMSVLIAVADAGSLSAASRKLGMPLATVSRKIAELEQHVKSSLLRRSARHTTLTDAGRAYVAACRRIVEQVTEAEREASGEYRTARGDLAVTAPVMLGHLHLLPIAVEFLREYPDVDLRLLLSDQLQDLHASKLDVAIRIGRLPDSNLIMTRVGSIRHVVCASPAYFAVRGRPQSPGALSAHACVTFDSFGAPHAWTFTKGTREILVPIRPRLIVNTAEAAIDAAIAGIGVTRVMSYKMAAARRAGLLEVALESFEPVPWPVSVVCVGRRPLPLKVRTFVDWITPRLKARLAAA